MDVYGKIWNERRMVIRERVLEEVPPGAELEDETLQAMIDRTITELFPDEYIRLEEKRKLRHMVFNSIRRMDVLQDVLEDETITEIMVNGPHHIFVEQAGRLYETGLSFEHQTRLENIVQQIASRGNRIVNESNPILDARLEDGSRVNIVVPPIALEGPVITIRKFPKEAMTMEKLLSLGALTKEACEFLQKLVIAKYNIFISGGTGAGKTTMVKLLLRFYDVSGGAIYVDGHDVRDFNRSELREMFGMVLQDTWLFNGTVMENIRYGHLDATDEEVIEAAKAAHVHHFIQTLPDGYQMVLNEEASNVSQGQKQLLTIARAILADPKILILDEATSSVDTRTELLIQKAMDNLMQGRTSFIIAHRLSTIRDADIILVMRDGDIVEQGTHEQLLAAGGFYASLYNAQFDQAEAG